VKAHDFTQRYRHEIIGVAGAQVGFGGEGQGVQVVERLQALGLDVEFIQQAPVEGHVLVAPVDGRLQPLELQLQQLLAVHALIARLKMAIRQTSGTKYRDGHVGAQFIAPAGAMNRAPTSPPYTSS